MALTPMMQQYIEVKENNKDCILFFRLGDFYEMFFEDAEVASRELELVLTGRDCGLENRAPMCGIPYHAASSYINKLVTKGYKVAICEQLEDPALAKGIVKRDVIKIITPGTYADSSFLEDTKNNYIMSIYNENQHVALCFADVSTGDFQCTLVNESISSVLDEISKFIPKEIILCSNVSENLLNSIRDRFSIIKTTKEVEYFNKDALKNIKTQFKDSSIEELNNIVLYGANGLLQYIIETQKIVLSHINHISFYNSFDYLSIDINSRRNLEITETLKDKSKKGSLLWVLDKTNTAMGARMLRKWLEQPLVRREQIVHRLDAIEEMMDNHNVHEDLKDKLKDIYDIERLVGKISSKSVNAKELIALKNSIEKIPSIKELLENSNSNLLKDIYSNLDCLQDVYEIIHKAIIDNPSFSVKEGGIIKGGYNQEIDELREAKTSGKEWIASIEQQEKEVTGIKSLKVGYNKVFGYYIEITKSNLSSIPENRYIRKQTLANCERYITPELKEIEEKVLGAQEKLIDLEYSVFVEVRDEVEKCIDRMQNSARLISEIDCLCSLALVAKENNYCKPEIKEEGELVINEGRHPIVEKVISRNSFVANDTHLNNDNKQLILITGPNMAGKSTYMRQVALINILAQIGSFVPAKEASIAICDKIFTRIGASDDLAGGKSTFMVEMWEVSNILKNATNKSLIILDEVGRGTSTYDGLSIAWSVIEYLCSKESIKCKTLFATHYHELTSLEGKISGVKNYSVAVKKVHNDIIFLRKIIEGGADESYGIEVAKLAGIPEEVIARAKDILFTLESKGKNYNELKEIAADSIIKEPNASLKAKETSKKAIKQVDFIDIEKDNLLNELGTLDILNMTPMEGFNKLYDIIKRVKSL